MVKVMVSIPEELLHEIDRAAEAQGKTRSRFLQDAARDALAASELHRRRDAVRRIRELAALMPQDPGFDAAAAVRHERDEVLP